MDFTTQYCPERKRLEQSNWGLVSRLSVLTDQLMRLIGKDHEQFMITKSQCIDMKRDAIEARDQLRDHRASHGC